MKYFTLLLLALLSLASSCQKDMPSDGHKNIFRCKVNGMEWTPHCISDPLFGCDAVDCQYYKGSKTIEIISIRRYQDNSVNQGMRLYKYNSVLGENELQESIQDYTDYNNKSGCLTYSIDSSYNRRLTILSIDTINFIVEGTFEFTAISECQDTVRITDGYFEIEYRF